MYLAITDLLTNIIRVVLILALVTVAIVLVSVLIYIIKLIKMATKLRARQYNDFNTLATKGEVVFLGDSLTEFFHLSEFFHDTTIYNRGIASDTTTGVLERLDSNVIQIEPSKVFIQIGTNDFNSKSEKNIPSITSNIFKIIETIKEKLPESKIYLISLYPVNIKAKVYSRLFVTKRTNHNIIKVNEILEKYARENNITYIDIFSHLLDSEARLNRLYTVEGLHISFEGYKLISSILKPYVYE